MIARLKHRRQLRRIFDDAAVVKALSALREVPACLLIELTGLRAGRIHAALERLEAAGHTESRWTEPPYPRRRLYRLAFTRHRQGC